MPLPWEQAQPMFRIAGRTVSGFRVTDPVRNRFRLPLAPEQYPQPVLFEVEYKVPAGSAEGRRFWQTPLPMPRFVGAVRFGQVRWLVSLPADQVPFVLGPVAVDYRWGWQGYLLSPAPAVRSQELERWVVPSRGMTCRSASPGRTARWRRSGSTTSHGSSG